MTGPNDAVRIFTDLKDVLLPYERHLVVVTDTPDTYYLDTAHRQKNGKPLFFASVKTSKKYVSFHLMPVYLWPELVDDISDELKKRMQGKSCFNLIEPNIKLTQQLASLTKSGFQRYRKEGFVKPSQATN